MSVSLRYGADSVLELDIAAGKLVAACGQPGVAEPQGIEAAIARALESPLGLPPLARCVTAGDRVVIALGEEVPEADRVVAAVIHSFEMAGVALDGISVLRTAADSEAGRGDPRPHLDEAARQRITVIDHDPSDRRALAYLALTESGEPIVLNRALTDADMVVPIGLFRSSPVAGHYGMQTAIYPAFSDQRAQGRFRSPSSLAASGLQKRQAVKAADDVGWLLGVVFTVQVVPGPGGCMHEVFAGDVESVRKEARGSYGRLWSGHAPARAALVVAAVEGASGQQTWANLGRSLAASLPLVEEGGAIAVCCELAETPGPAVKQLAESRSRRDAVETIGKQRPTDALAASQIAAAQEVAAVYLLSGLDAEVVEGLEIAPIPTPADVIRLIERAPSCLVLANAPFAAVTLDAEA